MPIIDRCVKCGEQGETKSTKHEDGSITIHYYCPNGCYDTSKQRKNSEEPNNKTVGLSEAGNS